MAVELKGYSWFEYGPYRLNLANVRYPWHLWLNGSIWLLVPGEDFDPPVNDFQTYAHGYAAKWGIKIRTKMNEAGTALFFQAYQGSSKSGDRRRRHFRRYERTWNVVHLGDSKWDYEPSDFLKDGKWDGSQWIDVDVDEDAEGIELDDDEETSD